MNVVDQVELARHLGISDRRVRQLETELVVSRLDGDPARYDLDVNARRYRLYSDHYTDTASREIEEASACVQRMFDRLRAEGDIQKRRQIAVEEGHAIGQLDSAMALGSALVPEHARAMMRTFTNLVVGRACSEFLELCERRLDMAAEDFQGPILQPQADIP